LFLAANPNDTTRLQIDQEVSAIDKELRKTEYRDRFDLRSHWATQYNDLQELFLRYNPSIVHFSGHGSEAGEVILQDKNGNARMLSVEALASLFAILKDKVKCVVLNTCYSEKQAYAIAKYVECVVGISRTISDSAAIDFASAFYLGLGYGRSIQTAFAMGRNRIDLAGFDEADTPQLLALRSNPDEVTLVNKNSLYSNKNNNEGANIEAHRKNASMINRLSGSQIQQLHNALLNAFDEPELRRMVRVELDANLGAIAGGTTLTEIVFNLITWAERTGNVVNLIQGAANANPTNSYLREFISLLDET
jgi:hypothetical protein